MFDGGTLRRRLRLWACCVLAACLAVGECRAQAVTGTQDAVKELLKAGRKLNGLTVAGIRPWRLKVNFERYDDNGKFIEHGTYEELWAGPDKRKFIYSSPSFSQVQYSSPRGLMVTGDRGDPPGLLKLMGWIAASPLPSELTLAGRSLEVRAEVVDGTKADGVYEQVKPPSLHLDPATGELADPDAAVTPDRYCLDADHVLTSSSRTMNGFEKRVQARYWHQVEYENRMIAGDVELDLGDVPVVRARVESIEPLEDAELGEFRIPDDARERDLPGVEKTPVLVRPQTNENK
jgi:hypothetical protein